MKMVIAITEDHGGFHLKALIVEFLQKLRHRRQLAKIGEIERNL